MSVTASSGSTRVNPQRYDTLPLSSVRQAEQQDRFPDGGELDSLITFFQSGTARIEAARRIATNGNSIVARAANRIFTGGNPLSYLEGALVEGSTDQTPLAADQEAFQKSVQTFAQGSGGSGLLGRILEGVQAEADVRVVIPSGFSPISVSLYGNERMRKSLRDLAWFLRYVGYAIVAGDPSILAVNTRGLRDVLEKGCSLAATNLALQEMRAAAAELFRGDEEPRKLVVDCFNVLLNELAVPTPSTRQRLGSPVSQGLQLPAIYALSAEGRQRAVMKPQLTGSQKDEVIRAAYRQVFERDIQKGYSQVACPDAASQVRQGQISVREFIRRLGRSKEYRNQFYARFSNSRAVELAFRHFLGRGVSSIEEFRTYFSIVSDQGLPGLVDSLINSQEYARVFGEETVPYLRDLGEEAQESAGWGSTRKLFRFSAPFEGAPQYITLYAAYRQPLPDQHPYGGGNDPLGLTYGAIFPSGTASVATRPVPFSYDSRRLLIGNGMNQPGQMASRQFRRAVPRRVGPTRIRLQQIASGGSSVPQRNAGGSVRRTEASTQAVIRAVYAQVLGSGGYAGEAIKTDENRLENGDISLRDFVRQVARSNAFRRRYWSGLYITKAIEVMHRRLLGRPTLGRWEIDSYFDTAARKGFYGVVDAMVDSPEYNECFGEDTVPYERFVTPADRNARQVPARRRPVDVQAQAEFNLQARPDVPPSPKFRGVGDLTPRNLPSSTQRIVGSWTAKITGEAPRQQPRPEPEPIPGPGSIRQIPSPARRWSGPRWQPGQAAVETSAAPTPGWKSLIPSGVSSLPSAATMPGAALAEALGGARPGSFKQASGRADRAARLVNPGNDDELTQVVEAAYRQLLNRVPFSSERLTKAESELRSGNLTVANFVSRVAASELFSERLSDLAPIQAATTAYLALLGRAATAAEVSRFLEVRATSGQQNAIESLLFSQEYSDAFGPAAVPFPRGLATTAGLTLPTINRTTMLFGVGAGLTPRKAGAL